ncbi:rho GTPase-activating protein 100F [Hydra vulgaris]|uniref:Rho GTPase-activating protein 100F n=1 Tax=Hydra vulgaris TaxID=6087 RepID=A0ABM4DJK0_HYDVU
MSGRDYGGDDFNDLSNGNENSKLKKKILPLSSDKKSSSLLYCLLDESELNKARTNIACKDVSRSVGDLTSFELYEQTDALRYCDATDGETSLPSNKVRKHLSKQTELSLGLNIDKNKFTSDLVEFKMKQEKVKSSAMRIAMSVENLFRADKAIHRNTRIRSVSDPINPKVSPDSKSRKFFKRGIFLKQNKQLEDNTELNDKYNNKRRLSIKLVEDTARKLSGIKEIFLDQQGNVIKNVEIKKSPGQPLGFYIRLGNGIEKTHERIFVSRVTLGSFVDVNSLFYAGDEILRVNQNEIRDLSLEEVASKMRELNDLSIEIKSAMPLILHSKLHLRKPVLVNHDQKKSLDNSFSVDEPSTLDSNQEDCVYESDKMNSMQKKPFTGSLHISIHKVIGCREQGSFSCSLETDGEFKAKTSAKMMQEDLEIDESFEIEINETSSVELKLFLNKKEKPSDIGRIHLENIFAHNNIVSIILKTVKFGIKLYLSLKYIAVNNFLNRAPSKRLKGVFGFNIAQTLIDDCNTIPFIVRRCVEKIEQYGLSLEGIYRINGNARKKKILRAKFDEKVVEYENIDEFDCHVVSGVLKDYLRELPQPLISQKLFLKIYEKSLEDDNKSCFDLVLLDAMKSVHYSNRETLIYVMEHLLRVDSEKDKNKMDFKNLAVCFGPVMMCPPALTFDMIDIKKQVEALKYLLEIWPKLSPQYNV